MLDLFPEVDARVAEQLDERYTTRTTMDLCMKLAGVDSWDLDAAACEMSHWAPRWYSLTESGLEHPWGGRTWVNPPFSELRPWVERGWEQIHRCERIAMLLPANRTEQPFWQELVEPFRDRVRKEGFADLSTHHLPGRIQFGNPGNPLGINTKNSPPFGCVLLVWRHR